MPPDEPVVPTVRVSVKAAPFFSVSAAVPTVALPASVAPSRVPDEWVRAEALTVPPLMVPLNT